MSFSKSRNRLYAFLLAFGAGILLYRTITMLRQGAVDVLVPWVSGLLIIEMLLDIACILTSINWWLKNNKDFARIPLRIGVVVTILHAVRVLIFVLGRIGPWTDFDVKPEQREMHDTRWTWAGFYLAVILSILGVVAVFIIWTLRKKRMKQT